jgi:OmcA/MtrC family decaheme c-type cytochrome
MSKRLLILMCSIFLVVPLAFMGCGSNGSAGPQGDPGEGGVAGPVTNTSDSCMVCHTTGRLVDIFDPDGDPITHDFAAVNLPTLVVSGIVVENNGDVPTVFFHVESNGVPVTALDNTNVRFMMAQLVPAGTATAFPTWNTAQFDRWAYERASTGYVFGTFDNTSDNATGDYSYTFTVPFGSPSPADNVVPVAFNAAEPQRLYIRVSKTGSYTAAGVLDFIIPADGDDTTDNGTDPTLFQRQFVTIDACRNCHGPFLANTAHGSNYVDVKVCVLCHSPIGSANDEGVALGTLMTDNTDAWLASLIHKVHAAIPMAAFANRINNLGYAGVTYPQDVNNCVTCHTNSGLALGAGDLTDNWRAHPTTNGCVTCHEGFPLTSHDATPVYATNGTAHPAGASSDAACAGCHPADGAIAFGASVTYAHDFSPTSVLHPNASNVPEFNVTLGLSPDPAFYVAGDNVLVTVTLNNHSDNSAVAGSVYTTAQGAAGAAGGGLRVASLYFYGPRAFPKPILAAQATNMFVNAADTRVATDNTGFKYNVTIPAGLTAGTYMVRVRIGDYGRVADNNYVVESIYFRTVQIGSATVTAKVAGDSCVDCHGNGSAPFHDARHIVLWDTDECIACHDYSGGHAATLSNRVHAVHAGNSRGDMTNPLSGTFTRNWDLVTYPADKLKVGAITRPIRCTTCHTSGNTSYKRTIHEVACLGCHGDTVVGSTAPGPAISHMLQSGGDYPAAVAP